MSAQRDVPAHEIFLKKILIKVVSNRMLNCVYTAAQTRQSKPSVLAYTKMKARVNINVYSPKELLPIYIYQTT